LTYKLASGGKFIYLFYLEITVEHPVTVQVVKGEEQLGEPPADPLASHEKAEVISFRL
jgi:hypothetical protein